MNECEGKIYGLFEMENICSVGVYHNLENGKREDLLVQSILFPQAVKMLVIVYRGFLFFQGWTVEDENRFL